MMNARRINRIRNYGRQWFNQPLPAPIPALVHGGRDLRTCAEYFASERVATAFYPMGRPGESDEDYNQAIFGVRDPLELIRGIGHTFNIAANMDVGGMMMHNISPIILRAGIDLLGKLWTTTAMLADRLRLTAGDRAEIYRLEADAINAAELMVMELARASGSSLYE